LVEQYIVDIKFWIVWCRKKIIDNIQKELRQSVCLCIIKLTIAKQVFN